MSHLNLELYKRIDDLRREDERRRADAWRRQRQIGWVRRGWLSRQGCWVLCRVGHALVRLGRRLEAYGAPQVVLSVGPHL